MPLFCRRCGQPQRIYKYMNDNLNHDAIKSNFRAGWLGYPVHYFASTNSTNDMLTDMAARGEPPGALVITDYQSHGKGRMGRRWVAPQGSSLLMSLLFRPDWPAEQAPWLTMIAGLAATEAIRSETNLIVRLKWPNDIMIGQTGEWRKAGGLLSEGEFFKQQLKWAVLGTGINVNIARNALPDTKTPATSLMIEVKRVVDRLSLLTSYLNNLESLYGEVEKGYSPHTAWSRQLLTIGREVVVGKQGSFDSVYGVAEGTDNWGRLLVRDSTGLLHAFSAGDVTLSG